MRICRLCDWQCGYAAQRVGEASHPGPQLRCPGCGEILALARSGGDCAACELHVARSTPAYKCRPCSAFMCTECVEAVQDGLGVAQVAVPVAQGVDAELLEELRKLPEAFPCQPVLWVPRRSRQAASGILCDLLSAASEHGEAPEGAVHAEVAHRLARAAGQILFRPPAVSVIGLQTSDDGQPGLATVVRDRLRRAAAGKWEELIAECVADVDIQAEAARAGAQRQQL